MRPETNPSANVADPQAMIRKILEREASSLPKKYQNPKLEKRTDVATPFWFIRARVADPSKKKARTPLKLGFCHEMNQKEAMKTRGEVLRMINSGLLVTQARVRFRELVTQFEQSRLPQFRVGTQARYKSQIHTHILPAFGDRQLADIDAPMIEAWLAGKERDGLSWWSREGLRGVLSAIFAAAKQWKFWTGENPTIGVRIGERREVRNLKSKPPLTPEQLQAILAAISESTRFIVLIAVVIGLRISEIMGLRWEDIDLDGATLTVNRRWYRGDVDEPKTPASKRTRQLGALVGEFKRRFPGSHKRAEYIFLGDDGLNPQDERDVLRYELRPALKRLKIHFAGFGWHHFRRQNVTWRQTVGGASPMEAQRAAGHTHMDTTAMYFLTDGEREAEQVTAIFDRIMGGGTKEGPKQ